MQFRLCHDLTLHLKYVVFLAGECSGYHILCFSVFSIQLLLFPGKLAGLSLLRFLGFILWIYILGKEAQTEYSYKTFSEGSKLKYPYSYRQIVSCLHAFLKILISEYRWVSIRWLKLLFSFLYSVVSGYSLDFWDGWTSWNNFLNF